MHTTIPLDKGKVFAYQPNIQLIIGIIFSLGVATALALLLGVVIAVAYLLNIAVSALAELATNLASVYSRSDSIEQFFMIFIGCYITFQFARHVARPYMKRGAK